MGLEVQKFKLRMMESQRVDLPSGIGLVRGLAIQKHSDHMSLWTVVETEPNEYRKAFEVELRATGQSLNFVFPLECYEYLGNAQIGKYVYHVWILN